MRRAILIRWVAAVPAMVVVAGVAAPRHTTHHLVARGAVIPSVALPTYLPAGARLLKSVDEPSIGGTLITYSLAGVANRRTVDTQTFVQGTGHPESLLRIAVVPSVGQFPPADPAFFTREAVAIGQYHGSVVVPKSGYGPYSVVWSDGSHGYRVSVDRFWTPDGVSGISLDEVLHVAASMA
jgi:hypothetical protein